MDNPSSESSNEALTTDSAAAAFAALLDPQEPIKEEAEQPEVDEAKQEPEAEKPEEPAEPSEAEDGETVTIEVDGKTVELTKAELADAYKNGLRQADYTRKTMEASEQRKAAEAEKQAATQERQAYAVNLQKMAAQLEGALQEQQSIDWNQLLESDPVEYLKQQHLFQQRQAAYQQNMGEQQKLAAQFQAEQQKAFQETVEREHQALLDKLPDWKDEAKAKADKAAIREYLLNQGYAEAEISQVADAKAVLVARKAMLYDQMIEKAKVAAKKVQALPQKVERPATGNAPNLDKRSSAFQRLSKTGSVNDAAAVFSQFV